MNSGESAEKYYWETQLKQFEDVKLSNTDSFEYLDFVKYLPKIPEDLLIYDIEEIENFKIAYAAKLLDYKSYDPPNKIYNFLRPYFPHSIQVRYQLIKEQLPIHVDHMHVINQRPFIFNYVLFSGGSNVNTRHWKLPDVLPIEEEKDGIDHAGHHVHPAPFWGDDRKEGMEILNEVLIPEKEWCRLNISIPHDISEIETPRLLLTVFETYDHCK